MLLHSYFVKKYFIIEVLEMATVKKNKKKKIIIAISIVLVIAILSTVIGVAAKANKKPVVSLYTIGTGNINETVSATGVVSSGSTKEYKVGGVATVKEVFVQVGDEVKEGDKLATFDTSSLDNQQKELQNTYNQAKSAYNDSVAQQKTAKNQLRDVNSEIASLEKTVNSLSGEVTYAPVQNLNAVQGVRFANEDASELPTQAAAEPTSAAETTTRRDYDGTIQGAVEALEDLIASIDEISKNLEEISGSIQTTNELVQKVMDIVLKEIEEGNLSSEAIAKAVAEEMAKVFEDALSVEKIQAAVSAVDWEALGRSITGSENVQLATAEMRLAALYAEQKLFSVEASDDIVNAKKQIMDSSKSALDVVKEANDELTAGWTAAFDGTVTECDINAGDQTNLLASGITIQNMDSMVVTISLGEYDIHKVKLGMPAVITTAYGKYTGEILTKAPIATGGSSGSILDSVGSMAGISGLSSLTDSGAGVEVQVSVDAPDENIIIGFDADVEIQVGDYNGIITVPIESIILEKTGTYVYVYNEEEGAVTKTLIETGAVSDSVYEVKSGLNAGDKIVATPSSDYEEDTFEVKVSAK